MLAFNNVAVFILATTKPNMGGFKQDYTSYFESRMLPILNTWGSLLPQLYFVFGTNVFDYEFVESRCLKLAERRRLRPHSAQTPSKNSVDLYKCPITNHTSTMNVLWVGNCTGEYFGLGPTCRCQEAMRYFNSEPRLFHADWFVFMDDDIYLRPHAMVTMLSQLSSNTSALVDSRQPLAIVAPSLLRDFGFSKAWSPVDKCSVPGVHQFLVAQPAIINRAAMSALQSAIDANGLTALQNVWGGSHDTLLGVLLWMYMTPVYSLQRVYYGSEVLLDPSRHKFLSPTPNINTDIVVHCVRSYLRYGKHTKGKPLPRAAVASQHNIAMAFGEEALYDRSNSSDASLTREQLIKKQEAVGVRGSRVLQLVSRNGVLRTRFGTTAKQLAAQFVLFTPADCALA